MINSSWFAWNFPGFSTGSLTSKGPFGRKQTGTVCHHHEQRSKTGGDAMGAARFSHRLASNRTFFVLVRLIKQHRIVATHAHFLPSGNFPPSSLSRVLKISFAMVNFAGECYLTYIKPCMRFEINFKCTKKPYKPMSMSMAMQNICMFRWLCQIRIHS